MFGALRVLSLVAVLLLRSTQSAYSTCKYLLIASFFFSFFFIAVKGRGGGAVRGRPDAFAGFPLSRFGVSRLDQLSGSGFCCACSRRCDCLEDYTTIIRRRSRGSCQLTVMDVWRLFYHPWFAASREIALVCCCVSFSKSSFVTMLLNFYSSLLLLLFFFFSLTYFLSFLQKSCWNHKTVVLRAEK